MKGVKHSTILICSLLVTFIFLAPIIFFGNAFYFSVSADNLFNHWLLQYNYKALAEGFFLTQGYFNTNQYYPFPGVLALADISIFPSIFIYAPLFILTNSTLLSFNLTIFIAFFLTFLSAFYCLDSIIKNKIGSFVGALVFTFAPFMFVRLFAGHTEYLHRYFVPPLLVGAIFFFDKPDFKKGMTLFTVFFLSWITNLQLTIFSSIFIMGFFIHFFIEKFRSRVLKDWLWALFKHTLLFIPFLAVIYAIYHPYLDFSQKESYTRTINSVINSAGRVRDFFTANFENYLYGKYFRNLLLYKYDFSEHILSPGFLPWALFSAGAILLTKKNRYKGLFIISFIFGCLMALGPFLSIGKASIKLPYWYLYQAIFLIRAIRTPTRIMMVAFFFFSAIIGYLIKKIDTSKEKKGKTIIILVVAFIIIEFGQNLIRYEKPKNFLDYDLKGKKVMFLPFNNYFDSVAYYLIHSLDRGFIMTNGIIGTQLPDYSAIRSKVASRLFTDRWVEMMKILYIDLVILYHPDINGNKNLKKIYKEKKAFIDSLTVYENRYWSVLDMNKASFDGCTSNSHDNIGTQVLPLGHSDINLTLVINLRNNSGCGLKFIQADRYVPIEYEVIGKNSTKKGSLYLRMFPIFLKDELIKKQIKIPVDFHEFGVTEVNIKFYGKNYTIKYEQ